MTTAAVDAVEEIRERVRAARRARRPLRIVGAGTWTDGGRPIHATDVVSTASLTGIVEYVPGDLTITARAGTTLAELHDATARHGQWLTLDPWGGDAGTIGATIATATAGPLATGFGTPRDVLLGMQVVTGMGTVVRGGGRVVKNVAGFDLPRLLTGSWGTLGIITEVTLRLRGAPPVDITVLLRGPFDVTDLRARLAALPLRPVACELVCTGSADFTEGAETAVLRLQGNGEAVAAQEAELRGLGALRTASTATWDRVRSLDEAGASVWRLSAPPSRVWDLVAAAREIARRCPGARWHASLLRGVVRCMVPADATHANLTAAVAVPFAGTRIFERMPADIWPTLPPAAEGRLTLGIKRAFDPDGILNPGLVGDAP